MINTAKRNKSQDNVYLNRDPEDFANISRAFGEWKGMLRINFLDRTTTLKKFSKLTSFLAH